MLMIAQPGLIRGDSQGAGGRNPGQLPREHDAHRGVIGQNHRINSQIKIQLRMACTWCLPLFLSMLPVSKPRPSHGRRTLCRLLVLETHPLRGEVPRVQLVLLSPHGRLSRFIVALQGHRAQR